MLNNLPSRCIQQRFRSYQGGSNLNADQKAGLASLPGLEAAAKELEDLASGLEVSRWRRLWNISLALNCCKLGLERLSLKRNPQRTKQHVLPPSLTSGMLRNLPSLHIKCVAVARSHVYSRSPYQVQVAYHLPLFIGNVPSAVDSTRPGPRDPEALFVPRFKFHGKRFTCRASIVVSTRCGGCRRAVRPAQDGRCSGGY